MKNMVAADLQRRRFDIMPKRMRTALLPCPADMPSPADIPMPEEIPEPGWDELDRLHAEAEQVRQEEQIEADHNTNEYRKGRW